MSIYQNTCTFIVVLDDVDFYGPLLSLRNNIQDVRDLLSLALLRTYQIFISIYPCQGLCYASRYCDIAMTWVTIPWMEKQKLKPKWFLHCWVRCSDVYIKIFNTARCPFEIHWCRYIIWLPFVWDDYFYVYWKEIKWPSFTKGLLKNLN